MARLPPEKIYLLNFVALGSLELIVEAYDRNVKAEDEEQVKHPEYVDLVDAIVKAAPQTGEALSSFLMEQAWCIPSSIIDLLSEARRNFYACEACSTTKAEHPTPADEYAYKAHTNLHEALKCLRTRVEGLKEDLPEPQDASTPQD